MSATYSEDREWAARALAGEAEALARVHALLTVVVRIWHRRVTPACRASVSPDDVVQTLYLRLVDGERKLGGYEGRSALATWLHGFVRRQILNVFRDEARRQGGGEAHELAVVAPSAERLLPEREALRAVAATLGERPAVEKLMFRMCVAGPTELQDLARALGVRPAALRKRKERLISALRDSVELE